MQKPWFIVSGNGVSWDSSECGKGRPVTTQFPAKEREQKKRRVAESGEMIVDGYG